MRWICKDCGNASLFTVDSKIDATAIMNAEGEFRYWGRVNLENPIFFRELNQGTVFCKECNSINVCEAGDTDAEM